MSSPEILSKLVQKTIIIFVMFALAEHINSTLEKIKVRQAGLAMPNVRARVQSILNSGLMVASVARSSMAYCKVQLLSQSAYSTMAMTEVVEILTEHRVPVTKGASSVGEGTPGRATMYGKGGRAVRLSVAVRFCRLVSFFSLKGLDRQGSQCPI